MAVTAALHIYLQTLPRFGGNTVRGAMKGTGGGSAAVFVVCAAVVWPVGTLLGYHIRVSGLFPFLPVFQSPYARISILST